MAEFSDPKSWIPATWHPDFGDVRAEFEHLRQLAQHVIEQHTGWAVGLSVPEPGYMFLTIADSSEETLAEVWSIENRDSGGRRMYGVFLHPGGPEEDERYTPSMPEVVEILKPFSSH